MQIHKLLLSLLAAASLAGCCNCHTTPGGPTLKNLPPPISAQEQTDLLNARAASLPNLRAPTHGLDLRWLDPNGKERHESADGGYLLIRQHFEPDSTNPGDILLTGTVLGQTAVVLGKNDKNWWYALYLGDNKTARVGDVNLPPSSDNSSNQIFRADLHLQMLGISKITPTPSTLIAMQVDDTLGKNHLFIESPTSLGFAQMQRQIIIDRITGNIDEVDLYDSHNTVIARSHLSNYQPVQYTHGSAPISPPPLVPTLIDIDFPTLKATVRLTLFDMEVRPSLPDLSFELPDFPSEGLKVQPAD